MKNLIWESTDGALKFKTLEVNGFQIFGDIEFDFANDDASEDEGRFYFDIYSQGSINTSRIHLIESGARETEEEARQAVEKAIEKHIHLALQAYSRLMFEHFEESLLP